MKKRKGLTKAEELRMQIVMREPGIAERLRRFADAYFEPRIAACVQTLRRDFKRDGNIPLVIRAAFIMGVASARDYQKNPPPGLVRLARNVHVMSKQGKK